MKSIIQVLCVLSLCGGVAGSSVSAQTASGGRYFVAVDSQTSRHPEWGKVVRTLCQKYGASTMTYPKGDTDALLPKLRMLKPRYVCFVSKPECVGRELVVGAAQTLRKIDEDPFGDAIWGIVTGYDADDAMRMVSQRKPFVIRRAATSMGGEGFFKEWESGFASDEGNRNRFWTKRPGDGKPACKEVSPDPAKALAEAFNQIPVDYWCTSGHARERNWQIVFNQDAGFVVHKDGALLARDSTGASFPFRSPNPKVYVAAGNCLIGHIDKRDCMTTAWIHSGGVDQMVGYTVVTFYGFMGWGTKGLFESGRFSLAESFFLNNQILLWKLGRKNPALLAKSVDAKGEFSPKAMIAALRGSIRSQDELGLFWDRDTVAFYGDPAWRVACPEERRDIETVVKGNKITLRFLRGKTFPDSLDHKDMRPVGVFLPSPPPAGSQIAAFDTGKPVDGAVVTESFALLPLTGRHEKGEELNFKIEKK